MTTHFLPILAEPESRSPTPETAPTSTPIPHHALIVTHHLLSPTKRKLLIQLSSELNLVGFSKTGHPGILYAIGEKEDIVEWLVQVRSWNWLALKVRVTCEPVPEDMLAYEQGRERGTAEKSKRSSFDSSRSKNSVKARGDWVELEKLADCLEWMKKKGRDRMLTDAGVGSSRDA